MKITRLIFILLIILILIVLILPLQIISNILNLKFKYLVPYIFFKLLNFFIGVKIELDQDSKAHLNNISKVGSLYVSNHVSWIDIVVIGSLIKSRFIAKKEVKTMGLFGFLATLNNTFFIDNSKTTKSLDYSKIISKKLLNGENLILFPEGTTSDGSMIRKFKSSFFESANSKYICPTSGEEKFISVYAITLCYLKKNGLPMGINVRRGIAWIGSYPMARLMYDFLVSGNVSIYIKISDAVTFRDFGDRKKLSSHCENTILINLLDTIHPKAQW